MEKLNLGCGPLPRPDYLNVDLRKFDGVDLVADIRELQFTAESFMEIYAKDVIEHVSFEDAKKLLRNCYVWLKRGGSLIVHTNNIHYLAEQLAGTEDYDTPHYVEVLRWVYGDIGEGDTHYSNGAHRWGYSTVSFSKMLSHVGFKVVEASVTCQGFGILVIAVKQ